MISMQTKASKILWVKENKRSIKPTVIISVILFILSLLIRTIYEKTLMNYLLYPDSQEYLDAALSFAKGRIDMLRMPVYPAFLHIVSLISGYTVGTDSFVIAVTYTQRFLSSIGVVFLYHALVAFWCPSRSCYNVEESSGRRAVKAGYILSAILAAFYAVSPAVINWDFLILTESLTMFFVSILLWSYFSFLRNRRLRYLIMSFVLSGLLMFIKPFYLFFPVIMLVFSVISCGTAARERKRNIIAGIFSVAVIFSLLGWYVLLNGRQNGYYGVTGVGGINSFGKVLQYKMYDLGPEGILKDRINKAVNETGHEPDPLIFGLEYGYDKANFTELSDYAKNIIVHHPIKYLTRTLIYAIKEIGHEEVLTDYCDRVYYKDIDKGKGMGMGMGIEKGDIWPQTLFKLMGGLPILNSFYTLYLMILLKLVVALLFWKPRVSKARLFIFGIILYQLAMSLVGSHGEYGRLMAPAYILIFITWVDLLYITLSSYNTKREFPVPGSWN